MADTLKFGPEWLRALSDGNSVGTPPPSPAVAYGKYKLADYRYGREEMLALINPDCEIPEDLHGVSSILVEKAQEPLAFIPLSEEEQRIMSQSVNSAAVLRMMGRGAPPVRGGRGVAVERGRGRGRGRGEGFMQRGMSYDENDSSGFGRGRSHLRPDGWEEAGAKRFDRTYQGRYEDPANPQKLFQRSLSNDNWRVRGDEEEDDEGDWRRAGTKWNTRGSSWRDPLRERGFEFDRVRQNNINKAPGFSRQYQRSRSSESWDDEDLPEWSVPDQGDMEELGTFDASGAFVSNKVKRRDGGKLEDFRGEGHEVLPPSELEAKKKEENHGKESEEDNSEGSTKDTQENKTEKLEEIKRPNKPVSPRPNTATNENNNNNNNQKSAETNSSQSNSKAKMKSETSGTEKVTHTNASKEKERVPTNANKNHSNSASSPSDSKDKKHVKKMPPPNLKPRSEAEALEQLKETVETMVADMTVEDEEKEMNTRKVSTNSDPSLVLPPDHENSMKWFYRDPQGDLQGPFLASEMAEWFSAGYFTMNLAVKRGIDEKFSPLGELIKRWGRVPFLSGPTPPPLLNSPQSSPDVTQQQHEQQEREQQEQLQVLQQQMIIQQQFMQQQMIMRHIQLQQIQTLVQQLQENEQYKALPPLQQQQIAMQMLLKQPPHVLLPHTQPSQSSQQKLSPRTPPLEAAAAAGVIHPSFHRSLSTPGETSSHSHTDDSSMKGLSHPTSIWDIETSKPNLQPNELEAHLKRLQMEKEETDQLKKQQEEEQQQKRQTEIEHKRLELQKQQEEIQQQKEQMEQERQELERKRLLELQKIEEEKRRAEEERRRVEEERRREEQRRREEEEHHRLEEEERRREEAERLHQEALRQQELDQQKRQQDLKRQELQRQMLQQQEIQRQREQEEIEKQKQSEIQRRQELQRQQELRQQEAVRKLQQEQLANMQLPAHAQWASSSTVGNSGLPQTTLAEIEQEEREQQERDERMRKQLEAQRQQSLSYQQQQQQQQKSWTSSSNAGVFAGTTKSLLEIQEEQARQLEREMKNREQQQPTVPKNISLASASVWSGGVSPSNWASEGAWGNAIRAGNTKSPSELNSADTLGFWDEAIITSAPVPPVTKRQSGNKSNKNSSSSDFPALGVPKTQPKPTNSNKSKPSKFSKDEEAVQRLFQSVKPTDDFSQWCETNLRNMATSVDIPTFIAFLQEVDSPYEVHDYVRSYLGETKAALDFAKQFLEKRSQYRNKSKPVTPEDSIWGPAPAITPRELRQQHMPNPSADNDGQKGKGGKKKKKMMKVDNSFLGFTVHAAPDRINVGELDIMESGK